MLNDECSGLNERFNGLDGGFGVESQGGLPRGVDGNHRLGERTVGYNSYTVFLLSSFLVLPIYRSILASSHDPAHSRYGSMPYPT